MFERSHPKKWKAHMLPGKLSFDFHPASLARYLDVIQGNLLFLISELEMASGMLYVISLLKNPMDFLIMHEILSLESGSFHKLSTTSISRLFLPLLLLTFLKLNILGSSLLCSLVKQVSIHVECHPFFPHQASSYPPSVL